jgi:hypothetical protein
VLYQGSSDNNQYKEFSMEVQGLSTGFLSDRSVETDAWCRTWLCRLCAVAKEMSEEVLAVIGLLVVCALFLPLPIPCLSVKTVI